MLAAAEFPPMEAHVLAENCGMFVSAGSVQLEQGVVTEICGHEKCSATYLLRKGIFLGAKNFSAIRVLVNSTPICFQHWRPLLGHIYIFYLFQLIQLPVFSQWRTPTSLFVLPSLS